MDILIWSCLFDYFLRLWSNIILTLFLSDHLNFFENLFLMNFLFFSFFLWVFKCWSCFLLGLCGLWNFRITCFILNFINLLLNFKLLKNLLFSCKLFLSENEFNFGINFSIVYQKICAFTIFFLFPFKVILKGWSHSSKTLCLNTVDTKETDKRIIELKPLILFSFYKRYVMSWFCISDMNDDTCQFIIIFTEILWLLLWRLLSVEMLQCVRINIEFDWELMFGCYFLINESIQIKHNSLKMYN